MGLQFARRVPIPNPRLSDVVFVACCLWCCKPGKPKKRRESIEYYGRRETKPPKNQSLSLFQLYKNGRRPVGRAFYISRRGMRDHSCFCFFGKTKDVAKTKYTPHAPLAQLRSLATTNCNSQVPPVGGTGTGCWDPWRRSTFLKELSDWLLEDDWLHVQR